MRTSIKSIRALKITLLMRTLFACLVVLALSLAAIPSRAGDAEDKARKAKEAVDAAKKDVKDKTTELERVEKIRDGLMGDELESRKKKKKKTPEEEKALEAARAEVAKAQAALAEAEAALVAARLALEQAINELPDGDFKEQLKRERNLPSLVSANGLYTVKFDTPSGQLVVRLPDDMRAGDTISGTVTAEPKGTTPEERTRNEAELNGYVIEVLPPNQPSGTKVSTAKMWMVSNFRFEVGDLPVKSGGGTDEPGFQVVLMNKDGKPVQHANVPFASPIGTILTSGPPNTFALPRIGQQGRPVRIPGPFDGNSDNTKVMVGGKEVPVLAESPRNAVFESPTNVTGPTEIAVKEGTTETKGEFRNLKLDLTAPKTSLLKGESTELKVQVSGLEGITNPVPLQLDATGVITMDGGNFQNLRITPTEVNQGGTYTTTRSITGQQAGAFTVVATVVVSRFDVCLQDDSVPSRVVLWNTFTGDYIFTNPAPPPRPGGQPPSGGTITPGGTPPAPPDGTSLTGTGKLARKGCVIVLTHNAPDRRVFARLDGCNKAGEASVQTTSPSTKFTITDRNISDNTGAPK